MVPGVNRRRPAVHLHHPPIVLPDIRIDAAVRDRGQSKVLATGPPFEQGTPTARTVEPHPERQRERPRAHIQIVLVGHADRVVAPIEQDALAGVRSLHGARARGGRGTGPVVVLAGDIPEGDAAVGRRRVFEVQVQQFAASGRVLVEYRTGHGQGKPDIYARDAGDGAINRIQTPGRGRNRAPAAGRRVGCEGRPTAARGPRRHLLAADPRRAARAADNCHLAGRTLMGRAVPTVLAAQRRIDARQDLV